MQNKEPDGQSNMLWAIALSMAVLFIWTEFFMPKPQKPAVKTPAEIAANSDPAGAPPTVSGAADGAAPSVEAITSEAVAPEKGGRVVVDTPSLKGSISLQGARIDDLTLSNYHTTIKPGSQPVRLFSPASKPNSYFSEHGWIAGKDAGKVPTKNTIWNAKDGATLTPSTPLDLSWDNGAGLLFKRTISVDENYMFKIVDAVENKTDKAVTLYPYARIFRYGIPEIEGFFIQHEGPIGVVGEEGLQELTYDDLLDPKESVNFERIKGGWLGFTDKYWAATLIPDQTILYQANLKLAGTQTPTRKPSFQSDYVAEPITIGAGQTNATTSHLFAGAKKVSVVEKYAETMGIDRFDLVIDWGYFWFITKPLYHLMGWLYELLGNFGLSIIATTFIVKLIFFPLANKGYESMARMKKLQPEMEKLRERFKDDKERLQKAMMELYQKEKVNPMAGCLPILLQIPVFFALYKVVFISLDMRHAPFFGWIQDLSAPDPTSIFNLFGLLPLEVPGFLLIGIWPILMGVTMWLQMQLNPPQPDPTQQMIFNWMPVFFTFLLGTFASGLVIYWTVNNVLSILQQYTIMKRQGADMHLMDNIKKTVSAGARLVGLGRGDNDSAKS
ncbi:MAG: membrane protein insertase YidC [Hyphomicrobiaceae bacterium]